MKIIVYAICKNEEKFVDRWYDSMKEADDIYVLDTGSCDNTVQKLLEKGVHVSTKKYKNWRFDKARNDSLNQVPSDVDICVCTDLDEVFEKGWRQKLEDNWSKNINLVSYNYNWQLDENNKPMINFYISKIHSRNDYKWVYPVHEVLKYIGKSHTQSKIIDSITLNHYPDNNKSRGSYLKLLELSIKENPTNDRNMHYLGREYMYYGKYNKAIDTLIRHLNLKAATWKDERCASMRFIARCYKNLNRYDESKMWLEKAIKEAPYLRDAYVELAILEYENKNYYLAIKLFIKALKIHKDYKSYINEIFCNNLYIYDYLSLCFYELKDKKEALKYINLALKEKPTDIRLLKNKQFMQ